MAEREMGQGLGDRQKGDRGGFLADAGRSAKMLVRFHFGACPVRVSSGGVIKPLMP